MTARKASASASATAKASTEADPYGMTNKKKGKQENG
jgi:hypothetical protein